VRQRAGGAPRRGCICASHVCASEVCRQCLHTRPHSGTDAGHPLCLHTRPHCMQAGAGHPLCRHTRPHSYQTSLYAGRCRPPSLTSLIPDLTVCRQVQATLSACTPDLTVCRQVQATLSACIPDLTVCRLLWYSGREGGRGEPATHQGEAVYVNLLVVLLRLHHLRHTSGELLWAKWSNNGSKWSNTRHPYRQNKLITDDNR
jgi:hypothetical protein